ncbi:MAG: cobyric acid synthase [SAR324 cluster bacterium]|nr:cobyric acid synthase [SAR324 cluster bacterium]MBL7035551.1 cobyric acid synthase [SAR324 cluster bacterium]
MSNILMFQGTGSGVGKSVLAAGFCRLLKNRGFRVLPFKAQNMALNSGVTAAGLEMGRAQIVQAEACGVEPDVRMNPILLKPQGSSVSQLIRLGKVVQTCSAREYYTLAEENFWIAKLAFDALKSEADWIVMEGAGSPAEINLQATDIVNMRMAEYAGAKVILIGDIDRGGVFAWLKGTYDLIQSQHRPLLQGMLINKFRGDVSLLQPGIEQFKQIVPVPVLGVIPWREMQLEDEDSQNLQSRIVSEAKLDLVIIRLPHISNFSDFDPLKQLDGVSVRFVKSTSELGSPDLVILPGSKNTVSDLRFLHQSGFAEVIKKMQGKTWILGICGGFQMLGNKVEDPLNMESSGASGKSTASGNTGPAKNESGLGLLPMTTVLEGDKKLVRRRYQGKNWLAGIDWTGYEIHLGRTEIYSDPQESFVAEEVTAENAAALGVFDRKQKIIGTYIHGWLESPQVIKKLFALFSAETFEIPFSFQEAKEREMNELAEFLEVHCEVEKILQN